MKQIVTDESGAGVNYAAVRTRLSPHSDALLEKLYRKGAKETMLAYRKTSSLQLDRPFSHYSYSEMSRAKEKPMVATRGTGTLGWKYRRPYCRPSSCTPRVEDFQLLLCASRPLTERQRFMHDTLGSESVSEM